MKLKNNKHYKLNIKWILLIFIIMLILSSFYVNFIKHLIYENTYSNISELSKQTATQLNVAIVDQKKFVEVMVNSINRGYFDTIEDIFDRYKGYLEEYHFTRLVVLDEKGNGITSDGHIVNNYKNIEEFFIQNDDVYLSENRPSTVSNNQVNIYSKVFHFNGEKKVLFATVNTENYKEILLRRLFNGQGGTYLINNNGSVLIDSFDIIKEDKVNLYEFIKNRYGLVNKEDTYKIDNMAENIKRREIGTFDIKLDKDTYFIHYENINVNDWYVVTVAPADSIAKQLTLFVTLSLTICLIINVIVIAISIYIDISNQHKNRKLYKIAYIDSVTLLGNETYFKENGLEFLQKQGSNKYIIVLDINKFKALNNIYGYEFCNSILKELGQKLKSILPQNNITCRISNDVFATIFSYEKDIKKLLNTIFHNASKLKVNDTHINVNLSIGVYKIDIEDKDINKVLDKAYMARAKIKGLYNDNYYIFDDILQNKLIEEQKIESCMEEALENREFKIVYQPKTFAKNEKLTGAEALVRWYREDKIIPPNEFIPLFEKNKFIVKLDLYIFEQVCRDIYSWKEKYNYVPIISVNVSKEHFIYKNFIDEYVKISEKYNIDRSKIDLEITESAMMDGNVDIRQVLNSIKEKGFVVSIDDFGTGYSSLSMLQNMPIDIIKIDKVFVDKADLKSDKNIINYIMLIAKHLGVKTIVEGVETKEQVEFVRNLECDVIQGYYYSKPIKKEDFEDYFNKNR